MAWVQDALPWLGALALAVLLLVLLVYWPLRLDVSGRARGEADGRFVVAGGASLSFIALAFVWARGRRPELNLLVFGHKWRFRPRPKARADRVPEPRPSQERSSDVWDRVDPQKLLLKLLSERRHLRLRYLVLDLAYGFRDPMLTGRLVGAIYALSGVLPRRIEIRQRPRWDFEDGWEVALDGRAFVKPWLVLLETAAYVVRQMAGAGAPSPTRRVGLGRKDHDRREQEPPTRKTGEAGAR